MLTMSRSHALRGLAAGGLVVALTTAAWGVEPAAAVGPNSAQAVTVSTDAAALAQSLVGAGVEVSNAVLTGATGGAGSFAFQDPTVIGFSQGLVLGSGSVADVVGPNTQNDRSTDWAGPGDPDLTALAGYDSLDAVVLEFDFVPTANQVVFQYAFGSEEYSEWVASPFNDVFAFFVNGTNYAEVRQVAGDPTAPFVPVAVNNINNGNPYVDPPPTPMRPTASWTRPSSSRPGRSSATRTLLPTSASRPSRVRRRWP